MRFNSMVAGVILALGVAVAPPARADLAPPGLCTGQAAGDACDEAVDEQGNVVGSGVCVAETCRRATPDGSMTYDCVMCRPKGGTPTGGAGGGGQAGAAPSTKTSKSDSGCSLGRGPIDPGAGGLVLSALGAAVLLRRRRSRSG